MLLAPEREAEKLKEAVEKTKKESEAAEMEKTVRKMEEGFAKKFKERLAENAKIIRAKEIETDQLNREAGKMKEEVKKKKTALEEAKKEKWQEAFKASLTQDGNEIHEQLEEKVERIRVLEIENLKEENKELHKAKDTTRANSPPPPLPPSPPPPPPPPPSPPPPSGSQIGETEDGFVPVEDSEEDVELEQEIVEKTSKCSEEAGTSVQKSADGQKENLYKSRPQKRTSETKEHVLVSMRKEHEMFRTIIESGLSQLMRTPQ